MVETADCDIVIVGAGTAGCVLAEALTRHQRLRVTLVEAGPSPSSLMVSMPAGFAKLFRSKLDWALESEPQRHAGGRRIFTPRGKMLGGSANMNAQIHQWGHPQDFADWERLGAAGWSWDVVAPVFRRQEAYADRTDDTVRGEEGPQNVCLNRHVHDASRAFVSAARAAGLGLRSDYNGDDSQGAFIAQVAHRAGRRWSVYDACLKPAMQRRNLRVVTHANVTGVTFSGKRATGVEMIAGRQRQTVRARAVVLAAGAFASPDLLMRSGVGDGETLRASGQAVVHHLPGVGRNLHDHPMTTLTYATSRRDTFKAAESPGNLVRYLMRRAGPLASNVAEAIAFARTSPELRAPDVELLFAPLHWNDQALKPPAYHGFTIGVALLAPVSRGAVLRGDRPDAPPRIDFNFFSDAGGSDKSVLAAGMRIARRVSQSSPLSGMIDGEMDAANWNDGEDALLTSAWRSLQTVYHPGGTCRMGSDANAVVSPRGEVAGVEGLWVSDASVMPSPVRGHPNATVAMLAERMAGFVRNRVLETGGVLQ